MSLAQRLSIKEREWIAEALEACGGNKIQAAKMLGISRFILLRRLQRHEIY
ncbi:helix-turn-helix domain-containing protein [Thermanaerovibrio acidaminovorans]|uniref:helix-turn-helix domain-containing protein n=1 Tax=Thermanaerovibrio acidaminovorans TaxID=81462 RepID=UPI0013E8D56B